MTPKFNHYLSIALLFFSLLFINACKNPTDGLIVTVNSDLSENNYGFIVANANPDVEEVPQDLNIKIVGPDADYVLSSDGTKNFEATSGLFSLILKPGVTPSESNPIKFTIMIESNGFLKSITPIEISNEGNESFTIYMVKASALPEGVAMKEQTIALPANGELEETTVIEVPMTNGKQETAIIEIPKGTKMLDADGNVITGSIYASVVHFDNRSEESLNSFPGGFTATNLVDKDGNAMEPVVFETAGFISIEMSNGTQSVKSFSNPIEVTMEINDETFNPENETNIKEGDSIPTWSLDTKTGQWTMEDVAVVVKNPSTNKLETVFPITHLSYWNLGFKYNTCPKNGSVVTFKSSTETEGYRYIEVRNAKTKAFISSKNLNVINNRSFQFNFAHKRKDVLIRVYSGKNKKNKGDLITESGSFKMCGSSQTITIPDPVKPPTIVNIEISGKCQVGGRVLRPSFFVYFKEKGKDSYGILGYLKNGRLTTDRFEIGKTYIFATVYSGKLYEYEQTVQQNDYTEVVIELPLGTPGCK